MVIGRVWRFTYIRACICVREHTRAPCRVLHAHAYLGYMWERELTHMYTYTAPRVHARETWHTWANNAGNVLELINREYQVGAR